MGWTEGVAAAWCDDQSRDRAGATRHLCSMAENMAETLMVRFIGIVLLLVVIAMALGHIPD